MSQLQSPVQTPAQTRKRVRSGTPPGTPVGDDNDITAVDDSDVDSEEDSDDDGDDSDEEADEDIVDDPWWNAHYTPLTPPDEMDEYREMYGDGFDPAKWGFDQYEIDYNPSIHPYRIESDIIKDEDTLDSFLDAHKIAKGEMCSHTAIGGYRGGRWFIPLVMNNKFLVLFFRDSILAKRPVPICEKFLRERNFRFFVDWEMESPTVFRDFLDKNAMEDLQFLQEFGKLCVFANIGRTRFIFSRNPDFPNKIHINFPAVSTSIEEAKQMCTDLQSRFMAKFFTDDEAWNWEKIFDKGPYDNGGLRILGARKEGQRKSYQIVDLRTGQYEPLHIQQLVQTTIRIEFLRGSHVVESPRKILSEYEEPIRRFAAELKKDGTFPTQTIDIVDVRGGFDGRSFIVDLKDDYCPYICRAHSRASTYMYLFITRFGCWLKCYDSDCHERNEHHRKDLPVYVREMFDDVEQELDPDGVKSIVRKEWGNGDKGMALIAHHFLKNDVGFSVTTKKIYHYNETKCMWLCLSKNEFNWVLSDAIERALRPLAKKYVDDAAKESDKQKKQILDQWASNVLSLITKYSSTQGLSHLYPRFEGLVTSHDFESKFDRIPYLLGVKNGVIDLRTGELRERRREDNIFRVCPVVYDPDADTSFVDEMYMATMADDGEMRDYLQLCLGYSITGESKEEIVLVFTGQGRNTKGTTMQTMKKVIGHFMGTLHNGLILRRTGGNMDAERARIQGLRVALFNELGDGDVLNTAELQMFSGSDGISIKRLYCDPTEIEHVHHTCILTTNWSPKIPLKEVTTSIIERLIIINFGVTFTNLEEGEEPTLYKRQKDVRLKEKLESQLHVYLKWLVKGAVRYYQEGGRLKQKAPQKVKDATDAYFAKQNLVKRFITEECVTGPERFEECHAFFAQFQSWKPDSGIDRDNFVFGLNQLGITSKQVRIRGTSRRETRYIGACLKPVDTLEEGDDDETRVLNVSVIDPEAPVI